MIRVAYISVHSCPASEQGDTNVGGMNTYINQVTQHLATLGVSVDIYTRSHDSHNLQVIDRGNGVRVIHVPAGPSSIPKESIYSYLPDFIEAVKEFKANSDLSYRLIHSHYWLSGAVGIELSNYWEIPHVANFHTMAEVKKRARVGENEPTARSAGERRIMEEAHCIVALTHHEKDAMMRYYGASSSKINIISCGVDVDLFNPMDTLISREMVGLDNLRTIIYVGRIEPLKGIDILLRAFSQLDDRDQAQVVVIGGDAGGDQELDRLQSISDSLGISQQVFFLGSVRQNELPAYYSAADVCVVPSYYESFGLVALEAMACGTPVIASRVGGLATLVKNGLTGHLIEWRCPDPFADSLGVILHNESVRNAMGQAARNLALGMQWSAVAGQILSIYDDMLQTSDDNSNNWTVDSAKLSIG
jgi:D-inositol-3-phosphate glycosyltransferase